MRIGIAVAIASAAVFALPAAAQSYETNCAMARKDSQIGGALVGGILGGVLGSNMAGRGVREEGTAVGAVLGALAGSAAGRGSVTCDDRPAIYAENHPTYENRGYGYPQHAPARSPYSGPPAYPTYSGYGYPESSGYGYGDGRGYGRDIPPSTDRYNDLAGRGSGAYNSAGDLAGRECIQTEQITRLPDGSELRRPVDVCRDAYYSGWAIQN